MIEQDFANQIVQELQFSKRFWQPLHDRMDYWLNMYLLLDVMQQSKPLGYRRFITNDPRVAIDKAQSVLTSNDAYFRIDMPAGDVELPERKAIGKIERALSGIVNAIDEQLLERGDMPIWKQAAFFALMRGWIWAKVHITSTALDVGLEAPLIVEVYDPRYVYPAFDGVGLSRFIAEKYSTLGDLRNFYPQVFAGNEDLKALDLNEPCTKIEYWSNDRPGSKGRSATLVYYGTASDLTVDVSTKSAWVIEPYEHGLAPSALPVIGVPVNGIPIKTKPPIQQPMYRVLQQKAEVYGTQSWYDPSGWVAESGRGLLSTVEENIPQYNELVATALQVFSLNAFPPWVLNTATGEPMDFETGLDAKIPLRMGESLQRIQAQPMTPDGWRLMELLKDERQRGTLADIIQAATGFQGTGVLFQQIVNAARHGLEPFSKGLVDFGTQMGSHILQQLQVAKNLKPLSLVVRSKRSYMRLEFDPAQDLQDRKYRPVPVFKPALPEDMLSKAQIATLLLNPANPIMSLVTVLDEVFMVEDPEGEIERMLEDVANRDPIILLERLAQAFEEAGEPDFARQIRQKEFQAAFAQQLQTKQLIQSAMPQPAPTGGAAAPGPSGPSAQTGAPSATGGGQIVPGKGQPSEGPSPLGVIGQ